MDAVYKMRMLSDRVPDEVVRYIYANADNWHNQRVSWLEVVEGEVIQRIWYYRKYSVRGREETRYTECVRKITGDKHILWRNGYWIGGTGAVFQPVYLQKDVKRWLFGYVDVKFEEEKFNVWNECHVDLFDRCVLILNLSVLKETRYKYCAYPQNCDLMRYLSIYDQDHSVEFFGKCGLFPFPSLVEMAKKEKAFCRFLRDNAAEIDLYGPQATVFAYKNNVSVVEARRICEQKARMDRTIRDYIPEVKGTRIDRSKLYEYLAGYGRLNFWFGVYNDYLRAIKGLGLDLKDTKNVYPKDLKRMHDLRVNEFAALEAKNDREKRKKLYADFAARSRELKRLEWTSDDYAVIIPDDVSDLIREGEVLHHCVGKMGYDLKVVEGISIIAFLRKAESKETSLCTVEYRIDLGRITQCYGSYDKLPALEIRNCAQAWAEYVKAELKGDKENGKIVTNQFAARQRAGA